MVFATVTNWSYLDVILFNMLRTQLICYLSAALFYTESLSPNLSKNTKYERRRNVGNIYSSTLEQNYQKKTTNTS